MLFIGLSSGPSKSNPSVLNEVQLIIAEIPSKLVNQYTSEPFLKDIMDNICNQETQSMNLSQLKQHLKLRGVESILAEQNIEFDTFVENLHFFSPTK